MRKSVISFFLLCSCALWATPIVQPIRIGLLLPLQAEMTKRDMNMDRFVDFYSGTLLALYEAQSWGQEVELYVYDTGKSTILLQYALDSLSNKQVDMVIGPVYPAQVRVMAKWAMEHRVRTLLPFSSEVPELVSNPYLMQFNPSAKLEASKLVDYLEQSSVPMHCIFVEADETNVPESVRELQHYVKERGLDYSFTTVKQIMNDSLYMHMSVMENNLLVMNTVRYANLRPIMHQLQRAAESRPMTLLTQYSWQEEKINVPQMYLTVFNTAIQDEYYNILYADFFTKPRVSNKPCYDLLGYDLMAYVMRSLKDIKNMEDGEDSEHIWSRPFQGIQSDLCFERVGDNGGYQNMGIRIVRVE